MNLTLYYDKKNHKYNEKEVKISVLLLLKEEEKLAGAFNFNIGDFLNNHGFSFLFHSNYHVFFLKSGISINKIPGKLPRSQSESRFQRKL